MRSKLTTAGSERTLARILDALAEELFDVSDEDILEAAKELGMNPMMKGSAAFIGLQIPSIAELADFFECENWRSALASLVHKNSRSAPDPGDEVGPQLELHLSKRSSVVYRKH